MHILFAPFILNPTFTNTEDTHIHAASKALCSLEINELIQSSQEGVFFFSLLLKILVRPIKIPKIEEKSCSFEIWQNCRGEHPE